MTSRRRLIQSAIAFAVTALAALGAELGIADIDHYDSPLWGSTMIGFWAGVGLFSTLALVLLTMALIRVGLTRTEDPYTAEREIGEGGNG